MSTYSEIKYVDVKTGSDTTGNGDRNKPYKSIEYCISKLTTNSPLINIDTGIYTVSQLSKMSSTGKVISFKGKDNLTVLEIQSCPSIGSWSSNSNINNCIIRPSNDFSGETSALSYTNDVNTVNYYNVCFTMSENKNFPKSTFFYVSPFGSSYNNKNFYNCSFVGNTNVCQAGKVMCTNCALTQKTSDTININNISSLKQCIYDEKFQIIDGDNSLYGVYSGLNSWIRILLKMDGLYYSINPEFYNKSTGTYIPLNSLNFDYAFNISLLFMNNSIGFETFKPIDKFDNFSILYPSYKKGVTAIYAIKSNKELCIQGFDINASLMKNNIKAIIEKYIPNGSNIKIVLSVDMGETWFTIVNDLLSIIDCIIPKKRYIDFTNDDLLHFNAARETIYEVGCTSDILNIFDFNTLNAERLRFAYVFSTDSYINNPSLNKLTINYDEKGYQREMKDSECDIEVFDHTVKLKPTISATSIEANIII